MAASIWSRIREYGIMPLVTLEYAEDARIIGEALRACALPVAEVTFRTDAAEEAIRIFRQEYPDILVGAGTVLSRETAHRALEAGAQFVLSPGINPEVVTYLQERDVPVLPGCMSPSDLDLAKRLGLSAVKIFPIRQMGGLEMLKAVSAPFGELQFLVTGGVCDDNLAEYLSFPQVMCCGGSWMIHPKRLREKDLEGLKRDINRSVARMLGIRFAHLGVNDSAAMAQSFERLWNLPAVGTEASCFIGDEVELINGSGRGKNGHIAVAVWDMERAIAYYERKGIPIDWTTVKRDEDGKPCVAYFKEEFGGFAIHLLRVAYAG